MEPVDLPGRESPGTHHRTTIALAAGGGAMIAVFLVGFLRFRQKKINMPGKVARRLQLNSPRPARLY